MMAVFTYKGRNKVGNYVEGDKSGRNADEVRAALEREQIQVISVSKKRQELDIPFLSKKTVSLRELSVFNRQLSVMFNAGLPITQGLGILAMEQENNYFKNILVSVRKDVEGGSNLSDAMSKYPKVFNELYTSMIEAGEASGNLDTVLLRLSKYIEESARLIGKVKSALAYPIVVLIVAVVLTWVIMVKVVPVFVDMFIQLKATLPMPTKIVIAVSHFLSNNALFVFIGIGLGIFAIISYNKTYRGKRVLDKIKLKLPILGSLLLKLAVARVCRTLETLIDSGVEIVNALTITAKTSGNSIISDAVMKSRNSIQEGKLLGDSLRELNVFPFMVTQMISVGEETGALTTMLEKVADFYEEEVEYAVEALLSMMEPLMIVFLGGLVGSIIIAMYMPMFALLGKFG
jgi:type IV pilus assembly protein PilC